jgi:hypothetical protein
MRNAIDALTHNADIDEYSPGVLRRDEIPIEVNYIYGLTTHMTLRDHLLDGTTFKIRITGPDGGVDDDEVIYSGFLTRWDIAGPVDGTRIATGSFRPSGQMEIDGVTYGTPA